MSQHDPRELLSPGVLPDDALELFRVWASNCPGCGGVAEVAVTIRPMFNEPVHYGRAIAYLIHAVAVGFAHGDQGVLALAIDDVCDGIDEALGVILEAAEENPDAVDVAPSRHGDLARMQTKGSA